MPQTLPNIVSGEPSQWEETDADSKLQHFYCSIGKGQSSEAGEDRAAFLYEMLQFYKSLFLHAETKNGGKKDFKRARKTN